MKCFPSQSFTFCYEATIYARIFRKNEKRIYFTPKKRLSPKKVLCKKKSSAILIISNPSGISRCEASRSVGNSLRSRPIEFLEPAKGRAVRLCNVAVQGNKKALSSRDEVSALASRRCEQRTVKRDARSPISHLE